MDPNEALRKAREAADEIEKDLGDAYDSDSQVGQLIESFTDLDNWLCRGGFLPDAWKPYSNLITSSDVASLLGVGRAAVSNWKSRHDDFPRPKFTVGDSDLYEKTEVIRWWASRNPDLAQALIEMKLEQES